MRDAISNYLKLTKPMIMLLVVISGATALIVEGSMLSKPIEVGAFLLGLYLTGGSANSLNQYFERKIDAQMIRTSSRRPLPQGEISAANALVFSVSIGVVGILILGTVFNLLTALLATGTIVFYGLIYTLVLKPTTSQNIVVGGIAGAMAPVGAWAASTNSTALVPWLLFLLIFFWTPPHFWALAICFKDDYRRTRLPMMPVVRGDVSTLNQMLVYSIILAVVAFAILFVNFGWVYLVASVILNALFLHKVIVARIRRTRQSIWSVFKFSILYLFGLLFSLSIDVLIQ